MQTPLTLSTLTGDGEVGGAKSSEVRSELFNKYRTRPSSSDAESCSSSTEGSDHLSGLHFNRGSENSNGRKDDSSDNDSNEDGLARSRSCSANKSLSSEGSSRIFKPETRSEEKQKGLVVTGDCFEIRRAKQDSGGNFDSVLSSASSSATTSTQHKVTTTAALEQYCRDEQQHDAAAVAAEQRRRWLELRRVAVEAAAAASYAAKKQWQYWRDVQRSAEEAALCAANVAASFAESDGGQRRAATVQQSQAFCFRCRMVGHLARNCPRNMFSRRCFNCRRNVNDHVAENCPFRQENSFK